jgi:NDP-sugar pyrophosphorylase family protein
MKALILAAGYGTRLQQDIDTAGSEYQHLQGLPKQLLPIANKPLIEYLIDELQTIPRIDEIYVVTNQRYFNQFIAWAREKNFPESNIINDNTTTNEDRLGSIGDIQYAIDEKEIDDDLFVVCGDTLFPPTVHLTKLVEHFYQQGHNTIPSYTVSDEEVSKRGIIEVNDLGHVTKFLEKPSSKETTSRLACPPVYLYTRETVRDIETFLKEKADAPLKERDAPGYLVAWLYTKKIISTCPIAGRFDVGNLTQYHEANDFFDTLKRIE